MAGEPSNRQFFVNFHETFASEGSRNFSRGRTKSSKVSRGSAYIRAFKRTNSSGHTTHRSKNFAKLRFFCEKNPPEIPFWISLLYFQKVQHLLTKVLTNLKYASTKINFPIFKIQKFRNFERWYRLVNTCWPVQHRCFTHPLGPFEPLKKVG